MVEGFGVFFRSVLRGQKRDFDCYPACGGLTEAAVPTAGGSS